MSMVSIRRDGAPCDFISERYNTSGCPCPWSVSSQCSAQTQTQSTTLYYYRYIQVRTSLGMQHATLDVNDNKQTNKQTNKQCLLWPEGRTNFLQESFSPRPLPMGESLKILRVAKGVNFINFIHAKAHHHLLDVGDAMFSFFPIFVFFCRSSVFFFFGSAYHTTLRLGPPLRSGREPLFRPRWTSMRHVPGFLAIEAFAFFGKSASFLGCELLEASADGIGLHFCCVYVHRNIL